MPSQKAASRRARRRWRISTRSWSVDKVLVVNALLLIFPAINLREILTDIHALEEELLELERKYGLRSETFYAA